LKAGNSFAKAGKKLDVEKEHYKGKKSLFHSLRILMFGIQIAKAGRITNYGEANDLWKEIKQVPVSLLLLFVVCFISNQC
jgi:hypothetical protein